jgi:hypothetical protein
MIIIVRGKFSQDLEVVFLTHQVIVDRGLNRILYRVLKYKTGLTRRADTRTESNPKTYCPSDFRCLQRLTRPKLRAETT